MARHTSPPLEPVWYVFDEDREAAAQGETDLFAAKIRPLKIADRKAKAARELQKAVMANLQVSQGQDGPAVQVVGDGALDAQEAYWGEMIRSHVLEIRGYRVGGTPITSGVQLMDAAESWLPASEEPVVNELKQALQSTAYLERGLAEKFGWSPVSPPERQPVSNGGAPDASPA